MGAPPPDPGPKLWAAYRIPYVYYNIRDKLPFKVTELHRRYGPVVRIGPDHMSFTDAEAWQDLYGLQPGRVQNQKDKYALTPLQPGWEQGIILADDIVHARLRKIYGAAFTPKALDEQSRMLQKYADLLVAQMKLAMKRDEVLDMSAWCTCSLMPVDRSADGLFRQLCYVRLGKTDGVTDVSDFDG